MVLCSGEMLQLEREEGAQGPAKEGTLRLIPPSDDTSNALWLPSARAHSTQSGPTRLSTASYYSQVASSPARSTRDLSSSLTGMASSS